MFPRQRVGVLVAGGATVTLLLTGATSGVRPTPVSAHPPSPSRPAPTLFAGDPGRTIGNLPVALPHPPTPHRAAPAPPAPHRAAPAPPAPGRLQGPRRSVLDPRVRVTTGANHQVAVRALVLGVDGDDFGLRTWRATLDRVGAAYDVLLTRDNPLSTETLVRPDGTGRYNAILLTNAGLLYATDTGYQSGLSSEEWNLLWAYERDYRVRQATLFGSPGHWPEDSCLEAVSEGPVRGTPLQAGLTSTGAKVFDYLNSAAQIPVVESYVYRSVLRPGCAAQPVLQAGPDVLGALSTSPDGRERLVLTFSSNEHLLQSDLLVYGLFRWASRGLFLGELRHYLNVDVDDWFNTTDRYQLPGGPATGPEFQLTAHDAYNTHRQQVALRERYPLAATFTFNMAFNGGAADLDAGNACSPDGGVAELTATTRCLADSFRWINHTLNHPALNFTDHPTTRAEISDNLQIAAILGLPVQPDILKTPEYSGLGVYSDDPHSTIKPPTDHGLAASNPALLQAATELGVRVLHGNMSFPSHVPAVFNGGTAHPLGPRVTVIPDWPTNIAFHTATPQEQTAFYNSYYGPAGLFPYWPRDLTYDEMLAAETDIALHHVSSGSIYPHTFHIANLMDYGDGATLVTDLVSSVLSRYSSYYRVPVLNLDWAAIADHAHHRNAHFAALADGVDAVYDRSTEHVSVVAPTAGTVTVTGAPIPGSTRYGTDDSAVLRLAPGVPVSFRAGTHR